MSKQWYERLFENFGESYDRESFTHGTIGECDFIERELGGDRAKRILDVGCGTGRHSAELARRGFSVTGIDLSESMLAKARMRGEGLNPQPLFLKHDARALPFSDEFDAAIMLCEGSFPLMETDEMNFEILKNVTSALRAGGVFIFTTLNGLFPLFQSVNEFHAATGKPDDTTYHSTHFDLMTFRDHNITRFVDDSGISQSLDCNERYYVPSEITWLLRTLGYGQIEIFGAKLGAFSRNDALTPQDFEMLVIARR